MSQATALGFTILIPLVGAVVIGLLGKFPNIRESASLASAVLLFVTVGSLLNSVEAGGTISLVVFETFPGVPIALETEPLGMLFALLASFLWIVTTLYSIGYMRAHREKNQTRFYICFAIALACTMGVAFASNLFTIFLFYEILTLTTYPLVTHSGTDEARRAGRLYLGVLLGTSIGFQLVAIAWTWVIAGSLDFTVGGLLDGQASPGVVAALCALYVFGIGKAAVMPFHRWLPAAMVAPTPVSALLHAVAVVKAGVFAILKIAIYVFGLEQLHSLGVSQWLAYVAGVTILFGSLIAMRQNNLKARLAYSTVSQLGYIVLGAMLASQLAWIGAGMHIVMHGFGKITLFFCAGAILVAAHKTDVSSLRGLGRRMPLTMIGFFVGSLSVIGLPPLGGMWSKWYLALGTIETGHWVLLAVLLLSSLLNVSYLLSISVRAFFFRPHGEPVSSVVEEAPLPCLLAIGVTSLGCVVLFFYPEPLYQLMVLAVRQ